MRGWLLLITLFVVGLSTASAEPDRPLIMVPGILGSRLVDAQTGQVLWGNASALRRLERLVIEDGPRDPEREEGIRVDGLIQDVSIFGIWKTKQYSGLRQTLQKLGYEPGRTYFEFPYDWRQSNFTTAAQLARFVEAEPRLQGKDFDLLVHSMGGLIAEIFVRRHDPGGGARRVIFMGTPFQGSVNTLATLEEGWGLVENWLAGGKETVRRFALSTPSFYELLPDYANCCRLGRPGTSENYHLLTLAGWSRIDWLREGAEPDEARVAEALAAARDLRSLVRDPYPPRVEPFVIAGAGLRTRWQYYVDSDQRTISSFNEGGGDGTVPELSAVNGRPENAFTSLAQHATIFEDPSVLVSLRRILVGTHGPLDRNLALPALRTDDGQVVRLLSVGISTEAATLMPGESTTLRVDLVSENGQPVERVGVTAIAEGDVHSLQGRIEDAGPLASRAVFDLEIGPFAESGTREFLVNVDGLGFTLKDFVAVVPNDE